MKRSAHTLRGPPASRALPARLLHTLYVFSATSLMLAIAVIAFLFALLFRSVMPAPPRRTGRHVTFLEPSIVIPLPPTAAEQRSPTAKGTPSLSLTATPRELEPPTPDVAEDPLRTLVRICGFLASNTARAWRGDELRATPPLAGLAPYLNAVHEDLERINEMGKEDTGEGEGEEGGEEQETGGEVMDRDEESSAGGDVETAAGESAGPGASADAHDEPGLVGPDQAATHARPPSPPPPPSQLPTTPLVPDTSTTPSVSVSASASTPTPPPPPEPITQNSSVPLAGTTTTTATETATTTTTTTPGPRKRKDAVLRTTRPSVDPKNADSLADADDAAVRAAALLSRVADLGAGLFDGAVRERGAALWTAFSRHRSSPEVPVPPRTRIAAPGERI